MFLCKKWKNAISWIIFWSDGLLELSQPKEITMSKSRDTQKDVKKKSEKSLKEKRKEKKQKKSKKDVGTL